MAKKDTTQIYVPELEMRTTASDRKILDKKMHIGKQIYSACLGEAQKRFKAVLADKTYRITVQTKRTLSTNYHSAKEKQTKNRTAAEKELIATYERLTKELREIEQSYGYSAYQLHAFVAPIQVKFAKNIGSLEAQKLATRAFEAVEKVHYHRAKKVHFKRRSDDFSIENKVNTTGLRFEDGFILWGKQTRVSRENPVSQPEKGSIKVPLIVKRNDRYAHLAQEGFPPDEST